MSPIMFIPYLVVPYYALNYTIPKSNFESNFEAYAIEEHDHGCHFAIANFTETPNQNYI